RPRTPKGERMDNLITPELVRAAERFGDDGRRWLDALPDVVDRLLARWQLTFERIGPEATCSFVGVVSREGQRAMLKVPIPHDEAEHEPDALRTWNGDGAVRLLELDPSGAMLLELADPGTPLADH